jgi:hypothetical protein
MPGLLKAVKLKEDEEVMSYIAYRKEHIITEYVKKQMIYDLNRGLIRNSKGETLKIKKTERFLFLQLLLDKKTFDNYARKKAPYFQNDEALKAQLKEYDRIETKRNIATAIRYHLKHQGSVDRYSLDGADFTKTVKVRRLPPKTRIYSTQEEGFATGEIRQGAFYSPSKARGDGRRLSLQYAEQRGIAAVADANKYHPEYGPLVANKSDTEFDGGGAEVLESIAAPLWDTWSSEIPILTEGGGVQYQIIGEEKTKVKTLERLKVENILTKIEQGRKTTLTTDEVELLHRDIVISLEKGKFAASRNMPGIFEKAVENIERIGKGLEKIVVRNDEVEAQNLSMLKDTPGHALELLRPPENPGIRYTA